MRRSRPRTPASRVYSRITSRSALSEIVICSGVEPVRLDLLRHEVALRDPELLVLGVAGERDDVHAVEQRAGNRVDRVRGADEEHLREVERQVEVVVAERPVLLRVEHLEHRRRRDRRASPRPSCRSRRSAARGFIDSASRSARMIEPGIAPMYVRRWPRISASSRTPPTDRRANLRSSVRAIDCPSDVLPTPGRADEAEDLAGRVVAELRHREVLDDPVLDLLEVVVILVEHLARARRDRGCRSSSGPRQRRDPVEVRADDAVLGRGGGQALEPAELAHRRLLDLLGQRRAPRAARAAPRARPARGRPRRAPPGSPSAAAAGRTRAGPSRAPTAPATGSACRARTPRARGSGSSDTSRRRCSTSPARAAAASPSVFSRSVEATRWQSALGSSTFAAAIWSSSGQVRDEADDRARRGSARCASAPRPPSSPRARRAPRRTRRRGTARRATRRSSRTRRMPCTRTRSVPSGTRIILWTTAAVPIS